MCSKVVRHARLAFCLDGLSLRPSLAHSSSLGRSRQEGTWIRGGLASVGGFIVQRDLIGSRMGAKRLLLGSGKSNRIRVG